MRKIGWFDIKTKLKKTIRSIFYTDIGQELICYVIIFYISLVRLTNRISIIGSNYAFDQFKDNKPVIISCWHHQILMCPMVAVHIRKVNKVKNIASLASKHGDGRFIGKILTKYGVNTISGSTRDGRKANRGIDMHGLKGIFKAIKYGIGIAITPDGPRGPARKINGEIIKIAELTGAPIVPIGIGYSRYVELKSWDKLKIPLLFGKIYFYYGEPFLAGKNLDEQEIQNLNLKLEKEMNLATTKANKF